MARLAHPNFSLTRRMASSMIAFTGFLILLNCSGDKSHPKQNLVVNGDTAAQIELRYAKGFAVRVEGNKKWVDVLKPYQGSANSFKYLLIPREEPMPEVAADVKVIRTPLQSIICTSTSHLPLLEYIGEADALVGFPGTNYISSEKINARVDSGKVQDLGIDKSLNLEQLAVLRPDMLMGYLMSADYGQFGKIEALGIPVVINAEYLERHPLGRAEWIKFMALFFNQEHAADSIFNSIERQYLAAKQSVDTVAYRPTVISGIVYGDAWFMPGGKNYQAQLLNDAGCEYLWGDDTSTGFLELNFEAVFNKANQADLWIGVGSINSLKELANADRRYRLFSAFKRGAVYTYDARKGPHGGSTYLELGYVRPDIILQDLVKIAHPKALPGYELYFHRKLE